MAALHDHCARIEMAVARALERVENDLAGALESADAACAAAIALADDVAVARGQAAQHSKASFIALEEAGLIDARLCGALVALAGMRNFVAKQCQPSETAMIAHAIRESLGDLLLFKARALEALA